jgi:hypothetical protein
MCALTPVLRRNPACGPMPLQQPTAGREKRKGKRESFQLIAHRTERETATALPSTQNHKNTQRRGSHHHLEVSLPHWISHSPCASVSVHSTPSLNCVCVCVCVFLLLLLLMSFLGEVRRPCIESGCVAQKKKKKRAQAKALQRHRESPRKRRGTLQEA